MTKLTMINKAPCPPAISIAMVVRRWDTKHIAQYSMPRATPKATGHCHQATTHSVLPPRPPYWQQTKQQCKMYPLCWPFWWPWRCAGTIPRALPNGGGSWLIALNNNRGMTYQTDEMHLTSLTEYFVGGVSIAFNRLNNCFNIMCH